MKIKDRSDIVRDDATGAVVSVNKSGYNNYMAAKKAKKRSEERIERIENEVAGLKNSMNKIIELLERGDK